MLSAGCKDFLFSKMNLGLGDLAAWDGCCGMTMAASAPNRSKPKTLNPRAYLSEIITPVYPFKGGRNFHL